ncbi:MAG: sialidase family protein [Blastocatellia bacterium]
MEKKMSAGTTALIILLSCCLLTGIAPTDARRVAAKLDGPATTTDKPVITSGLDPRNETSLAVSTKNDQIIVGASKLVDGGGTGPRGNTRVAYYYSSDGGRTWGDGVLSLETPQRVWGRASDPSVVSDLDGNFYLCALMLDNGSFDSGVYVFKSTDGGRTFNDPTPVVVDIGHPSAAKQADKCYITVDTSPTSPFKNTIYAIWTSTEPDRTVVLTSHRRPGDAGFSEPNTISHSGDMRGPSITTGPNGELYAAWEGIGNPRVILFNASTDGGNTFLPSDVAPGKDFRMHDYVGAVAEGNTPGLVIRYVPRMNSFPVMDVDRSNGPNRGTIYVVWTESRNGADSDIFLKRLTPPNGGRPDVSQPIRVNNDATGAHQFFPWVSVDSSNGNVEVAFYDQRDDPGGPLINLYLARSTNGGVSFDENDRVSSAGSNPTIQAEVSGSNANPIGIGDYIALAAARGKAHMLWTDTRNEHKQEIYYGQVAFDSAGGPPAGAPGDACAGAHAINAVPFQESVDTRAATSSPDDPTSCSGSRDSNTVWYSFTPAVNTVYGIDATQSDYDTVVSVHTGACGSLTPVACNDNFGNGASNRSLVTFAARAGVQYFIEVGGKGGGGLLKLSVGKPVITGIEYTAAPDGSDALRITGAGFKEGDMAVTVSRDGEPNPMTTIIPTGERQDDGTITAVYATKRKLKKLVKRRRTLVITVESPAGSGQVSNQFVFTR